MVPLVLRESMFSEPRTAEAVFRDWVETVKNVCEILAILGGAAWTYLNYFRGRTYDPRLECLVEASVEEHSGQSFLRAVVRIRNNGLSKVPIQQKGTALLIYSVNTQEENPPFPSQVRWNKPVAAFDVFTGQKWVEPSEPMAESLMVTLPRGGTSTYKIALKVVSGRNLWTAETIVSNTQEQ